MTTLSFRDSKRREALQRARKQIAEWGLVPCPRRRRSLVLDFGIGEFEKIGEIEWWVANFNDEGYCGKFLFLFDGQTCPYHHHKMKHETFFVVKGGVRMKVNGRVRKPRGRRRAGHAAGRQAQLYGRGADAASGGLQTLGEERQLFQGPSASRARA